jgi:hypothetical protein
MNYYIDFKALDELLKIKEKGSNGTIIEEDESFHYMIDEDGKEVLIGRDKNIKKYPKGREIDAVKYDLVSTLIDTLLNSNEDIDTLLGLKTLQNSSLPLNLAITTLIECGVIKTYN